MRAFLTPRQWAAMLAIDAVLVAVLVAAFFGLCHWLDGSCRIAWPGAERAIAEARP